MNFLENALPGPRERVLRSFTNDLELRRNDPKMAAQFSATRGYRYRGSADLVLTHGRFYQGRTLPADYGHMRGPMTNCFYNALGAAENNPSLRYCEGFYHVGYGCAHSHAWCVTPDNELLELTFPSDPEELRGAMSELSLPFLPPQHWGYYGVTFDAAYVRAHADRYHLGMFDRSPAEISYLRMKFGEEAYVKDYAPTHDFPVLKHPYDPNRKEL